MPARSCWCDWVNLQLCECHFSVLLFLFLNGNQSQCIWICNCPNVQYILLFLPVKLPLRKGFTTEMVYTVGIPHRAITPSCPVRGFVKPLIVEQTFIGGWNTSIGVFLHCALFIFTLPYSHHRLHNAHHIPICQSGDFWLHAFTQSVASMLLNLI